MNRSSVTKSRSKISRCRNGCRFDRLPFYWRPLDSPDRNLFPERLPLELYFDATLGLLRQKPVDKVLKVLDKAYSYGSEIVGLMDSRGIGYEHAQDFLRFLDSTIGLRQVEGKDILEIGCGTGYLLHRLAGHGAMITGYEPGFSRLGRYHVPVIEKPFPSEEIYDKKYDLIIAYALLEHIADLDTMLETVRHHLKDTGRLVVAVPDCEDCIGHGDISMLLHEHFSYFTSGSLLTAMARTGYESRCLEKARFGGSIYCIFSKKGTKRETPRMADGSSREILRKFEQHIRRFGEYLHRYRNKSLGIYVPIRAMNILSLFEEEIHDLGISLRFFDDAAALERKLLPGFTVRIEPGRTLAENPPDTVLVYSYAFGSRIAEKLKRNLPKDTEVLKIGDL
jgi:SAM-dependent methyltransferase